MSTAIIDRHTIGVPPIEFASNEGRFLHVGPNEWVLNLGVIHAGTVAPVLELNVVESIPGASHPGFTIHDWTANHIGPAWVANLAAATGPVPIEITPLTATRGFHTLTLNTGEISNYSSPATGAPALWSLPSQHLTIVDRVV
jgi:hypothetical protein